MQKLLFLLPLCLFLAGSVSPAGESGSRPKIMITGFWPPTNEMLREFSRNSGQNPFGWQGENWEGRGYDVVAFFPEYKEGDRKGTGDFEVDFDDTREDLARITAEVRPVSLLSFGAGAGPWEIEKNFPDFWTKGPTLHSTLPVNDIAAAVNQLGAIRAWVDVAGDPGDFLCGYISHLGARYWQANQRSVEDGGILTQGFIHVGQGYRMDEYREAVKATVRAVIADLDRRRAAAK